MPEAVWRSYVNLLKRVVTPVAQVATVFVRSGDTGDLGIADLDWPANLPLPGGNLPRGPVNGSTCAPRISSIALLKVL